MNLGREHRIKTEDRLLWVIMNGRFLSYNAYRITEGPGKTQGSQATLSDHLMEDSYHIMHLKIIIQVNWKMTGNLMNHSN